MYNNKKEYTVKKGNERTKMHVSKKNHEFRILKLILMLNLIKSHRTEVSIILMILWTRMNFFWLKIKTSV